MLRPVDVAVELELAVAVPGPEEDDEQELPDDPEQDDVLGVLLGPADEAHVGQEADDGSDEGWPCVGREKERDGHYVYLFVTFVPETIKFERPLNVIWRQ